MIGIYQDNFIDFLKSNLGDPVIVKSKNIICRCPWCEYNDEKDHYHLWISTIVPLFNCFHCDEGRGSIRKLVKKINGNDISNKYIDNNKLNEFSSKKTIFNHDNINYKKELLFPDLKLDYFSYKEKYILSRFRQANINVSSIKGLVFDINEFIKLNNIKIDSKFEKLLPFFQSNFIGFITENYSVMVLRNTDRYSNFRYYKLKIFDSPMLDYYKINGFNKLSKNVILAEGIFDIFSEYLFDNIKMKENILLYASVNSKKYGSLIKGIVFNENIFNINIHILSDRGINLEEYKKMLYYNKYVINSLNIYYNKWGKDFNDLPCNPEKIVIK